MYTGASPRRGPAPASFLLFLKLNKEIIIVLLIRKGQYIFFMSKLLNNSQTIVTIDTFLIYKEFYNYFYVNICK